LKNFTANWHVKKTMTFEHGYICLDVLKQNLNLQIEEKVSVVKLTLIRFLNTYANLLSLPNVRERRINNVV